MAFILQWRPPGALAALLGALTCLSGAGCSALADTESADGRGDGVSPDGSDDGEEDDDADSTDDESDDGDLGDDGGDGDDDTDGGGDGSDGTAPDEGVDPQSTDDGPCLTDIPSVLELSPRSASSTASPVHVRDAILAGILDFQGVAIRTQEFFNYYQWDYAQPDRGDLAIDLDVLQPDAASETDYLLQIGIASEVLAASQRPALDLTLILDTSPNMAGKPFERLKDVCRAIAAALQDEDRVSIVAWDSRPIMVAHEVTEPNDSYLLAAIEALDLNKEGALSSGLQAGYQLATSGSEDKVRRVVLISNGDGQESQDDLDLIGEAANPTQGGPVHLVAVGVGTPETYESGLMHRLAIQGRGPSLFVGSAEEAWHVFKDRFANTFVPAALDIEVTVELPPGFQVVPFDENEPMPISGDARSDLGANDSLILLQRIRTCAPEQLGHHSAIAVTVTYDDPDSGDRQSREAVFNFSAAVDAPSAQIYKGIALLAYSAGLKALKSGSSAGEALEAALQAVAIAQDMLPDDDDLAEIRATIEAALG